MRALCDSHKTVPDGDFSRHMTDLTSSMDCRGIDTSHVGHVVLFDFPRDPSEYIRRVGRTARGASGTGQSSILVLGRQVSAKPDLVL